MLLVVGAMGVGCGGFTARVADRSEASLQGHPGLRDPGRMQALEAPERYRLLFETTRGDFEVEVYRDWARYSADRLHQLVAIGFYEESEIRGVGDHFVARWGLHEDPEIALLWSSFGLKDEVGVESNVRGTVAFARGDDGVRSTELFVNLSDNSSVLDAKGFVPLGKVVVGLSVLDGMGTEGGWDWGDVRVLRVELLEENRGH